MYTHMSAFICVCTCVCIYTTFTNHACVPRHHVYTYVYMYLCMHMCVCICVCIYMCIYAWEHTHTHTHICIRDSYCEVRHMCIQYPHKRCIHLQTHKSHIALFAQTQITFARKLTRAYMRTLASQLWINCTCRKGYVENSAVINNYILSNI